jgi:hypothetical protein
VFLLVAGATLLVVGVLGLAFGWASTTTTTRAQGSGEPAASAEQPKAFLAAFVRAVSSGDRAFLLDRMHPAVIERYGTMQCGAYIAELLDPGASLSLVSVTGPSAFAYASDGLSSSIPDTFTFAVDGTLGGRSGARDYHFTLVDGRFRIFGDCGDPVAGS